MSGCTIKGNTPLHTAAREGNLGTIKHLIENGADVDIRTEDHYKFTPLQVAIKNMNLEVAKFLIDKGANVDAIDHNAHYTLDRGGTLLHWAARHDDVRIIKFLLENGANVNATENNGRTPLCLLVKHCGSLDTIRLFVENGASLNGNIGGTPLYWAYYSDYGGRSAETANFLIEMGTDVNSCIDDHGDSFNCMRAPLHLARHVSTTALLISKGADVNITDKEGNTPLHCARSLPIAKFLVEKGANVNAVNNSGCTPLHCTASFYKAKFLIQKGANVNATNNDGYAPLHFATNTSVAKLLIENGADFQAVTIDGKTVLHTLAEADVMFSSERANVTHLLDFFLQKGIDVNVTDSYGNTPLHLCGKAENTEVAARLLERGANLNVVNDDNKRPVDCGYENGMTATMFNSIEKLFTAVKNNENLTVIKRLVASTKVINVRDDKKLTILHNAVQKSSKGTISFFLSGKIFPWSKELLREIDVNARSEDHWTPLHYAAKRNKITIVKLLLESGAAYDVTTIQGHTPLELTENDSIKHLFSLVKRLFDAVKIGDYKQVVHCISEGTSIINASESDGSTSLHWAISKGYTDIATFLLEKGAKPTQTTVEGHTTLHVAAVKNDKLIIDKLLKHVKPLALLNNLINSETKYGFTALHIAANNGSLETVNSLLKCGAIYDIKNKDGKRPIDLSTSQDVTRFLKLVHSLFEDAENDNPRIMNTLLDIETHTFVAVINTYNSHKYTLLNIIEINENTSIFKKLSEVKRLREIELLINPSSSLQDNLEEELQDLDLGFGLFD